MTENKKIAIQILNMFAENGFPTYNVEYMDGYFVIHFRVKGVWSGWKFGMWINSKNKEKTVYDVDKGNRPVYFDWSK